MNMLHSLNKILTVSSSVKCLPKHIIYISDNQQLKKAIIELKTNCERAAKGIRACPECMENWSRDRYDYFTKVCRKPHLIVTAKMDTAPYWPAKVMAMDGYMAYVEFFGDHTQADIPSDKCHLYTKPKESTNEDLNFAFDVIRIDCNSI